MTWFRMDLHIHTPASADYQDLDATYLHILQKAEQRGLDIIAFTDHNTASGIATMRREIEDLELLEQLGRLSADEFKLLEEYRRVLTRVLVLPGFEFTAAYGFHILGIFPPETSIRKLEHILMLLGVPEAQMELGSNQIAEPADVLTAYEVINEFGGLVIPAHVNAAHGVAASGARYGGQTKIAYTQSEYIDALEVTDLEDMSRRSTAAFFNGAKPEYPRRMHCIQGSDAHRISREGARRESDLGIGDRATEVLLPNRTFAALKELFASDDFARTRPYQPVAATPYDAIQAAREQGPTIVQAFHEHVRSRRSRYRPILKDIVAFANTNGGTIYVGMSANPQQPVIGVPAPEDAARGLREAIGRSVVPALDVTVDIEASGGKPVLVVTVPKGLNTPYATDAGQVFVRQEGQTVIALRDEIVQLVREAALAEPAGAYAGGTEQDRVWSAPRTVTDIEEEGEEPEEAEPAAEPVLTAHIVEAAPEAAAEEQQPPQREQRRPRRRRPRARAEAPAESPAEAAAETPAATAADAEEAARVTAALDLAAGLPTEVDVAAQPATAEAETPIALPAEPEPAPSEAAASAEPASPPPEKRPRRRTTRKPKEAGSGQKAEGSEAGSIPPRGHPEAAGGSDEQSATAEATSDSTQHSPERDVTPKSGVEILSEEQRGDERVYRMRDLANGRVLDNVTRKTARRLWRLALLAREEGLATPDKVRWHGDLGVLGSTVREGVRRYNLAWRDDGTIRYFFAVDAEGMTEPWREVVGAP